MKRAVVLIITNPQGRVLLLKRSADSRVFPGEYCLPGGKVDKISTGYGGTWEADDVACIRECIEETGIIPTMIEHTGITACGHDQQYVVSVFKSLLESNSEDVTTTFPNREHSEFGFFDVMRLPKEIGKLTQQIILQVL